MRKNSVKHVRINQAVQRELSNIIRTEVKDPRVGIMTSVTAVDVATDLKTCKVYISVLGNKEEKQGDNEGSGKCHGLHKKGTCVKSEFKKHP